MKLKLLSVVFSILWINSIYCQVFSPSSTYMFSQRTNQCLYLDIYNPTQFSGTKDKDAKATVIFAFGGGFITGNRTDNVKWYKLLADNGYRVVAIDYRLGLKGQKKVGVGQVKILDRAIRMAVADLYEATAFLLDNADDFGIDTSKIIISGTSAGAITALDAEYRRCINDPLASILPKNFRYAGVVAYSGAILSMKGGIKFKNDLAPILMFHGTNDKLVNYDKRKFANIVMGGSNFLAKQLAKENKVHQIYRYTGHGHEVATFMTRTNEEFFKFVEENVIEKAGVSMDCTIDDPRIPIQVEFVQSTKELYGRNLED